MGQLKRRISCRCFQPSRLRFSQRPAATGWSVERIATAWIELMRRLGYDHFVGSALLGKSSQFRRGSDGLVGRLQHFPKEIVRPSRRWAEHKYSNIIYWGEPQRGGHFAAFEQPAIFVDEIRNAFPSRRP